jgi:methylthioribulose-1-phosphate dehydratase
MNANTIARELAAVGRRFYERGWAFGTSGNYSAVISRRPLRLAITSSGRSKRALAAAHILVCDERGMAVAPRPRSTGGKPAGRAVARARGARAEMQSRPSAETRIHIEIVRGRGAGAVLHTHSVWSTMLSERYAAAGGLAITGFEMLKGLHGVGSHEHREWIPILDNDQDMTRLSAVVARTLDAHPAAHALLLRRHGLYTWGASLDDAERQVEILEFLFETLCREA